MLDLLFKENILSISLIRNVLQELTRVIVRIYTYIYKQIKRRRIWGENCLFWVIFCLIWGVFEKNCHSGTILFFLLEYRPVEKF